MRPCPLCGADLQTIREEREVPVGRQRVLVEYELERCPRCGEEFVADDVYDAAQAEAASRVRQEMGLLTPEEILEVRKAANLTQAELEEILGLSPKTLGRWERGTVSQSKAADKLLRTFATWPDIFVERRDVTWVPVESGVVCSSKPIEFEPVSTWRKVEVLLMEPEATVPVPKPNGRSRFDHAA